MSALFVLLMCGCSPQQEKGNGLEEARRLLLSSRFNEAREILVELEKPLRRSGRLNADFLYLLGLSTWNSIPASNQSINEAKRLFEEIISDWPDTLYARLSRMNLARIAEIRDYPDDILDFEGAREIYRSLIDDFGGTPFGDEAQMLMAASYTAEFEDRISVDKGIALLEDLLDSRPDSPYRMQIHFFLGQIHDEITHNYAESVRHYRAADDLGIRSDDLRAKLSWKLAMICEEKLEDPKTAAHYFAKAARNSTERAYESLLGIQRLQEAYPELDLKQEMEIARKAVF
jgi:hypothetical protein